MITKIKLTFLAVALFLMTFAQDNNDLTSKIVAGDNMPTFIAQTLSGKTINTDELQGRPVLLIFFATWCEPCVKELPHIEELRQQYRNDELAILCVGREHSLTDLEQFNKKYNFTFDIAADPDRKIYALFAEKDIPRNYVIGKNGKVVYKSVGFSKEKFSAMKIKIEELIK